MKAIFELTKTYELDTNLTPKELRKQYLAGVFDFIDELPNAKVVGTTTLKLIKIKGGIE